MSEPETRRAWVEPPDRLLDATPQRLLFRKPKLLKRRKRVVKARPMRQHKPGRLGVLPRLQRLHPPPILPQLFAHAMVQR